MDPFLDFAPRIFDEHDDDGRGLDNEIFEGPVLGLPPPYEQANDSEIVGDLVGAAEQEAILRTLWQARDNRRPCPPMKAVDLDAPLPEDEDVLGAAAEAFPITAQLIEAWRAAGKPRIVRVDTEADHQAFRDSRSPERMAALERLAAVEDQLEAHLQDPDAHSPAGLEEGLAEAQALADLDAARRIPMRMPKRFDGLLDQWHEGNMAAGALLLPRPDGKRWVATASEKVKKGELEAAKAAVEAGVPAAAIVGYLSGIGATLAAADAIKSLASGAESLLRRPEARRGQSFLIKLVPQVSPTIFALAELFCMCQAGHPGACAEWNQLVAVAPAPLRQALAEIQTNLRSPAPPPPTTVGGAVGDFFQGLWARICRLFGGKQTTTPPALPAPAPKALPVKASA